MRAPAPRLVSFLFFYLLFLSLSPAIFAQTITVKATSPSTAPPGTVNLNVSVTGSGFAKGASTVFYLTGTTNPAGIAVNSTAYSSSTKVTANINVAGTAPLSMFDLVVKNPTGRSGKGTKLFAVNSPGSSQSCPTVTAVTPVNCYLSSSGCLDPSFGAPAGVVTTNPATYTTWAANGGTVYGAVVDSLGRTVTAGSTVNPIGGIQYLALVRYNTNGTLDTTFGAGGNGIVTSTTTQWINAVALQQVPVGAGTEQEIVVAGNAGNNFFISRYTSTGTLDTTFGTNGQTTVSFGSSVSSNISAIAVQGNGEIVLVGSTGGVGGMFIVGPKLALARLTVNGSLDTTFGTGGMITSTLPGGTAVVIQPDGNIVVGGGGTLVSKGPEGFVLARFLTSGAPDTTFGSAGSVLTSFVGTSGVAGLALDSSGRAVAVGSTTNSACGSGSGMLAIARYTTTGQLDTTFGTAGQTTTYFAGGNNFGGAAVAIQPSDQKILVVGGGYGGAFTLARFNTDGTLDTTFGAGDAMAGFVLTTAANGNGNANAIALDPSAPGTFIVVGPMYLGLNTTLFVVGRYFQ